MSRIQITWSAAIAVAVVAMYSASCGGSPPPSSRPEAEQTGDDDRPDRRRASAPDIGDNADDGLEVEGLRGRLDTYDIKEGIRPHERALEACYSSNVGRRRYIGGDVTLQFRVGKTGAVQSVHIGESDLGAWPIEKCLLDVCRRMTFTQPRGGPTADFSLPFSLPGRGRLDYWDPTRTQTEVAERTAELDACAAETGTSAGENVWITLYVATRGQVQSVGFAAPSAPLDEAWADCAAQKMAAWTLTDPRGRVAKAGFRYAP